MIERDLGPFEHDRLMPDQITTERLYEAQMRLMEFANYRPSEVMSSAALAKQMRGVSGAVTDIVLARGSVATVDLTETPGYDPGALPPVLAQNAFERYFDADAPAAELAGRSLVATPSRHIGATIGLHNGSGPERQLVCEVVIPTDDDIVRITEAPCQTWNDLFIRMQDFRTGQEAYPFHFDRSTHLAPREYLEVAQELSVYLLASSVPEYA